MPRKNKLGVAGQRTFPQTISAVCVGAGDQEEQDAAARRSLALRRSPRRQAVVAASKTKMIIAHKLKLADEHPRIRHAGRSRNNGFAEEWDVIEICDCEIVEIFTGRKN